MGDGHFARRPYRRPLETMMKRLIPVLSAVIILTSVCGLFGCGGQEESKTKTAAPAPPAGAAGGGAKKGGMEMPGP